MKWCVRRVILRELELLLQHGESPGKVHHVGGLRLGEAVLERSDPLDVGDTHPEKFARAWPEPRPSVGPIQTPAGKTDR